MRRTIASPTGMAVPALFQLGVEALTAHILVFYFGIFANLTPPVAVAAFAAADSPVLPP